MIRIGIVGLGKMGLSHLAIFRAHPDVEVAGICDSAGYLLSVLAKYTGVNTYPDLDSMLDSAEAARARAGRQALAAVLAGEVDVDRFFADLLGREPRLPDHLRGTPS